jgi:hypothetical protein
MTDHLPSLPAGLFRWETFRLTYLAAVSFQVEYGVQLVIENDGFQIRTRNAPGMEYPGQEEDFPQGQGIPLPLEEAHRIVELLQRVRITPFAKGQEGCDGVTYSLSLVHGKESLELGWWNDLPKGWRGLQPLQDLLEHYAVKYCRPPAAEGSRVDPEPQSSGVNMARKP